MRYQRIAPFAGGLLAVAALAGFGLQQVGQSTALAQAPRSWDVTVGTDDEATGVSTQAYFPGTLTINAGDTARFNWAGFHTVSFPGGQPAPPIILPGSEAGTLLINPQAFFASTPPGTTAVTYDGTGFLNSGTPPEEEEESDEPPPPFVVTFTAAGSYTYVCLLHPGMEGTIEVAPAGAALPETPAQGTARGQAQRQSLMAAMQQTAAQVQPVHAATGGPGGATVHSALAGLGQGAGASMLAFLPGQLTVRRGDVVVWTMPDPFEIHTVTFTSGAPPPEFIEPQFGPDGPGAGPPTLVIPARVAGATGGDTYSGTGYVNSGILGNGSSFALRFDAPAGSYEYLCLVHPFMKGTVTVTEP